MPRERVTMRKIREILRLVWLCGRSRRDTARTCGVCKSTVDATISRATAAGLSWPLPSNLDDEALERRLYPPVVTSTHRKLSPPDWQSLHDELAKHKHLTLMLLWQDTKKATLPATSTANTANSTDSGGRNSIDPCARSTVPARNSLLSFDALFEFLSKYPDQEFKFLCEIREEM